MADSDNLELGGGLLLFAGGVVLTAAGVAGGIVGDIESRMAEVSRREAIEEFELKKELQLFKKYSKKEG